MQRFACQISKAKQISERLSRIRSSLLGVIPLLGLAVVACTQGTRNTQITVDEELYVRVGGIDQWITIKGSDSRNPVVLVLHGGPGASFSPNDEAVFGSWREHFTVVQWDQRGAGRTYSKNGPSIQSTMTLHRMVQDGIEVAELLRTRLHKKKIALFGGSWGSALGVYMAKERPDLFCAYVGTAQMVDVRASFQVAYARVLELAKAANDDAAIKDLGAIGAPPWKSFQTFLTLNRWMFAYESKNAKPLNMPVSAAYASPAERNAWGTAMTFSVQHFFGSDLSGPLMDINLPALGTDFSIPTFIVQGKDDLRAPPELARNWLDSLSAPRKEFFLVSETGHEPSVESMTVVRKVLLDKVRPTCN